MAEHESEERLRGEREENRTGQRDEQRTAQDRLEPAPDAPRVGRVQFGDRRHERYCDGARDRHQRA